MIAVVTENTDQSWRKFQTGYLLKERKKARRRKSLILGITIVLAVCLLAGITALLFPRFSIRPQDADSVRSSQAKKPAAPADTKEALSSDQISSMVEQANIFMSDKNIFFVDTPEASYQVTTTIDVYLQEYLLSLLSTAQKKERGKPQRIALVAMDADTGKIVAMSGFDLGDPKQNPCTVSDYPAASVFKIITAAAAVQELGFTPHTQLYFNGNKYTLYKNQLKEIKNRYSYKISFSRAFAESVNPVFGKIGKNHLGREKLTQYADAFGFNDLIQSDLYFHSGAFSADGNDYHLAELGSGFNTETTISPLFGAMMVTAIVNSGTIAMPHIVEHITDSTGDIIYKSEKAAYKKAMTSTTAETMVQLMLKTVSRGTARKTFRSMSRDAVLSQLLIGGKTGSLYNKEHTVKYDWFIGFGTDKQTGKKLALSIVVGHRKYIGTRAAAYAKMMFKHYFNRPKDTTAQL